MGKGDKKTKKGKVAMGSFGNKRRHKAQKAVQAPKENKKP